MRFEKKFTNTREIYKKLQYIAFYIALIPFRIDIPFQF